jgi:hypothetical protein
MTRAKRKARKPLAAEPMDLPTPEQLKTGDYIREFVTDAESNTKAMAHRCVRDPVLRWERERRITDMQASTIRRMQGLWQAVYGSQKLTGRYGEPVPASTGDDGLGRVLEHRDDLRRIEGYFAGVQGWYSVFERVCRFGFTGPQACVTDSVSERAARDRALVIVQFVADFIAAKEKW